MSDFKDLENLMKRFLTKEPPGVAISVTRGEDILFEKCFGYADMAHTKPITPDTIYRLYSMTKPISALCGMIMYERGYFLMDDSVSEYLPEYKNMKVSVKNEDGSWSVEEAKRPILMEHLFNMAVGFYARDDSPTVKATAEMRSKLGGTKFSNNYDHLTEMRALAGVPMTFEPGEHWQYGYGLDIMTAVVQLMSGMTLGQFMQKEIFDPLGMTETGYRFRPGQQERMAECVGYDKDGKLEVKTKSMDGDIDLCHKPDRIYEGAQMGLLGTLGDYRKFTQMLANGGELNGVRIIGRKTLDMMRRNLLNDVQMKEFSNQVLAGYGYGYGVRTMIDLKNGHTNGSLGEYGWAGAAGTWMSVDPAEKVGIVFMQQVMPSNEHYFHHTIRAVVNGCIN